MDAQVAEVKRAIDKAEIGIILDTYDDIFSDFDPRPYSERALSEDFLIEARKRARDTRIGIELHFLVPSGSRDAASEALITQRLKGHFRWHYRNMERAFSKRNKLAVALIAFGMAVGLAAALLLSAGSFGAVADNAVGILFTIVSWYSIWTGLDRLMFKPRDEAAEKEFLKKMASAKIIFTPY